MSCAENTPELAPINVRVQKAPGATMRNELPAVHLQVKEAPAVEKQEEFAVVHVRVQKTPGAATYSDLAILNTVSGGRQNVASEDGPLQPSRSEAAGR